MLKITIQNKEIPSCIQSGIDACKKYKQNRRTNKQNKKNYKKFKKLVDIMNSM